MQKTTTWRRVPEYCTNFGVDPIQTKIFLRVTGVGTLRLKPENDPLRQAKRNLLDSVIELDLRDVFHRYRSGNWNPDYYPTHYIGEEEYDSESHFVSEMIEEKKYEIFDRIHREYGLKLNPEETCVEFEEVEEET